MWFHIPGKVFYSDYWTQMKYAVAMYRAGTVVDASDCDYDSAKTLGLICPFCSEAVFLRSGSLQARVIKDRIRDVIVNPAFCHYKNDDPASLDCELRASRPDGEAYIRKLRVNAHGQRLDLYNKHLWEMFLEDWAASPKKHFSMLRKLLGDRAIEAGATLCRHAWGKQAEDIYQIVGSTVDEMAVSIESDGHQDERSLTALKYFKNTADMPIHKAICNEIVDFLATRTAGYAFLNLYRSAILYGVRYDEAPTPERVKKDFRETQPESYIPVIARLVTGVRWIEIINRRLGHER